MAKKIKLIEIKKQGGGYSIYCDDVCIGYGFSAYQIHDCYQMFINGISIAHGEWTISNNSFKILNEASDIRNSD